MLATQHTDRTVTDDRGHARVTASRLVSSCAVAGVSLEAIARSLGVSRSRVQKYADPLSHNANIAFADLLCLPPLARLVFARALAESCGCALTTLPSEVESATDLQLAADAQRESSEAITALLDGIKDKHISVDDAMRVKVEATQAAGVFLRLVKFATDVIAQRGRVLR